MTIRGDRDIPAEEIKEVKNILFVDPRVLVKDNPASLIPNAGSYREMQAYFSPSQLDHPQVAFVLIHGDSGEQKKLLIIDGFTRTKYCADHGREILNQYPDFRFAVNDITDSLLKNPLVCPEDNAQNRNALTVTQYLRAIVPSTIAHGEIAKERIAAHLINSWGNMVGSETADKFSATAALTFVSKKFGLGPERFQQFLEGQKEFFVDETDEEHAVLVEGFSEMLGIVKESKLDPSSVANAAFRLVGGESLVIGGGSEARKQIRGILRSRQLREKLGGNEDSLALRENQRIQIIESVLKGYGRFSKKDEHSQILAINDALLDSNLTITETLSVINSVDPSTFYNEVRRNTSIDKLGSYYLRLIGERDMDSFERSLISILGGKFYISEDHIRVIAERILEMHNLINGELIPFKNWLEENGEELLGQGVNGETLENIKETLAKAEESVFSSSNAAWLTRHANGIREILRDRKEMINFQINKTRISKMADSIFSTRNLTPRLINQVVLYIFQEEGYELTEGKIEEKLNMLNRLDNNQFSAVIKGEITLFQALKSINVSVKIENGIFDESRGKQTHGSTRIIGEDSTEISESDKKRIEKQEREKNNRMMEAALDHIFRALILLGSEKDSLSKENREKALDLINTLGQIFLEEPNLVRLYEEYKKTVVGPNKFR